MKILGMTCRVSEATAYPERRDCLDQNWSAFLAQAGYLPLILPNRLDLVAQLLYQVSVAGVVLTGGNSPVAYQGDAPERDAVDSFLIQWASNNSLPLLGVCRGMQSLQLAFGQDLQAVAGQIQSTQDIWIKNKKHAVNAYHNWGTYHSVPELEVWASDDDGMVKAVKHEQSQLWGIMWHPERLKPFRSEDLSLFQEIFE